MKVEITTKKTHITFSVFDGWHKLDVSKITVHWLYSDEIRTYYIGMEKTHKLLIRAMMLAKKVDKIPAMGSGNEETLVIKY